ncbi:MAG: hypothetical protein U0790_14620 [Isosphaeraceae bacterium]
MAHGVEALIASEKPLRNGLSGLRRAEVIPLQQGLALVPVTDAFYDQVASQIPLAGASRIGELWKLSPNLVELARRISVSTPVAYVETDYSGGVGTQAAVVWHHGRISLCPLKIDEGVRLEAGNIKRAFRALPVKLRQGRPINQAIRDLGVRTWWLLDEFDAIGLGRYRSNEDWIEAAGD